MDSEIGAVQFSVELVLPNRRRLESKLDVVETFLNWMLYVYLSEISERCCLQTNGRWNGFWVRPIMYPLIEYTTWELVCESNIVY